MAFDSNSDTRSSMRSTGTFLCGEMAMNQSGRLSGSMCRNSKSTFFSRRMIAARCTQGQVLKLTNRYFVIVLSDRLRSFQRCERRPPSHGRVGVAAAERIEAVGGAGDVEVEREVLADGEHVAQVALQRIAAVEALRAVAGP